MDMSRISLAICVLGCCAVAATMCWSQPDEWPVLEGPYLGQMPPGDDPVVFAPGIISTSAPEGATSFSPDGSFLLFARARAEPEIKVPGTELGGTHVVDTAKAWHRYRYNTQMGRAAPSSAPSILFQSFCWSRVARAG